MRQRKTLLMFGIMIMFLVVRVAAAQDTKQNGKQESKEPVVSSSDNEIAPIEFGVRSFWGNVYGRPDLPFKPDLATSKLNEYSDIRNNFYVRRADITIDDILGTRNYVK